MALSSGPKSSGSAKATNGNTSGIAPRSASSRANSSVSVIARVITMRFPASELARFSRTLTSHLFENGLRTRIDEQPRHVLAELRSLVRL